MGNDTAWRFFLAAVLAIVILVVVPILTIISINTLFPVLSVSISWDTCCAVWLLLGLFITAVYIGSN